MKRLKRGALIAGMTIVTVNMWTGAPLLALWVGSRVVPPSGLSMLAVAVVTVTLMVACLALVQVLGVLNVAHDRLVGRPPAARRQAPWMKSLSGERKGTRATGVPALAALDYVLISTVVACVIAFEVWFFFFAGSPIG